MAEDNTSLLISKSGYEQLYERLAKLEKAVCVMSHMLSKAGIEWPAWIDKLMGWDEE